MNENKNDNYFNQILKRMLQDNGFENKSPKCLIIDDDPQVKAALESIIKFEWELETLDAATGEEALEIIKQNRINAVQNEIGLMIVDYKLPEMNGIEFLKIIKNWSDVKHAVKVILTGYADMNSVLLALNEDLADKYFEKPLKDKAKIKNEIEAKMMDKYIMRNLPEIFSRAMGLKSLNLDSHVKGVAFLAEKIAIEMNLGAIDVVTVHFAGILHDVGKIKTPEFILDKNEKLTNEEMEIMKEHVKLTVEYVVKFPYLFQLVPAVATHHENLDGSGYPLGLRREEIPLLGKILRVADSLSAGCERRTYSPGRSELEVFKDIKSKVGSIYDENVVRVLQKILKIRDEDLI